MRPTTQRCAPDVITTARYAAPRSPGYHRAPHPSDEATATSCLPLGLLHAFLARGDRADLELVIDAERRERGAGVHVDGHAHVRETRVVADALVEQHRCDEHDDAHLESLERAVPLAVHDGDARQLLVARHELVGGEAAGPDGEGTRRHPV